MIIFIGYDKYLDFNQIIDTLNMVSGIKIPSKDIPLIRKDFLANVPHVFGKRNKPWYKEDYIMSIKSKLISIKERFGEFYDEHPVACAIGFSVLNIATLGLGTYLGFKLKEHADIDHEMLEIDNPYDRDRLRLDRMIDDLETCPEGSAIIIKNHGNIKNDGKEYFYSHWYRNAEWTEDPEYGAEKSLLIENKSFKPKSESSPSEQAS